MMLDFMRSESQISGHTVYTVRMSFQTFCLGPYAVNILHVKNSIINGAGPGNTSKAETSIPFITSSSRVVSSSKSRLPISILPEDPEKKRKHIIRLVLEQFPYLSLSDNNKRGDRFNLNCSTLCPLCNGDHKEGTIWNNIRGECPSDEYCGEQTYRLKCWNTLQQAIYLMN
ncbi:unnamed protein product [Rhizophagus irregularis]|nr:unnamed protein product [Rhizophagus irregularis]